MATNLFPYNWFNPAFEVRSTSVTSAALIGVGTVAFASTSKCRYFSIQYILTFWTPYPVQHEFEKCGPSLTLHSHNEIWAYRLSRERPFDRKSVIARLFFHNFLLFSSLQGHWNRFHLSSLTAKPGRNVQNVNIKFGLSRRIRGSTGKSRKTDIGHLAYQLSPPPPTRVIGYAQFRITHGRVARGKPDKFQTARKWKELIWAFWFVPFSSE